MKTLFIKNMVCNRCIIVVNQELEKLGLHPEKILLGEVILKEDHLSQDILNQLDSSLLNLGFERMDDRKAKLIESIKNKVINLIHHSGKDDRKFNWSTLLTEALNHDYNYLSSLFSSVEGRKSSTGNLLNVTV